MIERAEEFGTKVYYGDGLRLDLLRTAGAETAKVIALCNDNEGGEMTGEAVKALLEAFPQAAVMVRAYDRVHMIAIDGLDIAFAERELFESAVAMGRAALKASGIDAGEIQRVEREYRLRDCERIEAAERDRRPSRRRGPAFSAERALPGEDNSGAGQAARQMLVERADNLFNHFAVKSVAALHVDMRFGIGAALDLGQARQRALGSSFLSNGRVSRRAVRTARTSTGASSQTVIPRSLSSWRVRGSTNTPPPVAMTRTWPLINLATSRRSPSR